MPASKITEARSTNGDDIRKEKVTPIGSPALVKPINSGMEEHEQKGVTVWVQNLLNVDFANLFVINMYLLTAFVTVFRSFANLNFVN